MEQRGFDVEGRVTIRVRHIWYMASTIIALTLAASSGYWTLRAEVQQAQVAGQSLSRRVETIECLVRQQTQFQIYGVRPLGDCTSVHR